MSIIGAFLGAISQGKDIYELRAFTTGADSYCYLAYLYKSASALKFTLVQNGEYPIYDAKMLIVDQSRWLELTGKHVFSFSGQPPEPLMDDLMEWYSQVSTYITLGNLNPHGGGFSWDAPIPQRDLQRYAITISARNGAVEQQLLLRRKDDGTFTSAFRLWRQLPVASANENGGFPIPVLLKEQVDDEFQKFYPSGIPWAYNQQ